MENNIEDYEDISILQKFIGGEFQKAKPIIEHLFPSYVVLIKSEPPNEKEIVCYVDREGNISQIKS